ncbi:MAG: hypothetical protein HYU66_05880 [Armatimonadetes bacterium]|nr:hypothetical protein [Armatimonadota bacterium]
MTSRGHVCAALVAALAAAAGAETTLTVDSTFAGEYVFRGYVLGRAGLYNTVSAAADVGPDVNVSGYVWNYTRLDGGMRSGELDYSAQAAWTPRGSLCCLTGGWVYYDSAAFVGAKTQEAYLTLDFNVPAHPTLGLWYDFGSFVGLYTRLGLSDSRELSSRLSLDLSGGVGFDPGRGVNGFNDFSALAELTYTLDPHWCLHAAAELVVPSARVASYRARVVPYCGFSYAQSF